MSEELRSVTTVSSEAEAEIVRERLLAEGIHAITQRTIGSVEWGPSGARTVMVAAGDLERARALLASEEGTFSDEELTRLSEEAGGEDPES
jgi:Putative prokaryotic signal transducing protein